jgi:hypothetical protein
VKLGKKITSKSPASDYHRLRIRCKALRYALEFHTDLYGKVAQKVIRDLVALQDLLGEHQDAEVAAAWLRGLIGERRSRLAGHTAFVAGRLAERYERRARRLRARFHKRRKVMAARNWARLQRAMQREALAGAATSGHRMPNNEAAAALQVPSRRGPRRKGNTALRRALLTEGTSE